MLPVNRYFLIFCSLLVSSLGFAQGGDSVVDLANFKPDLRRALFHEYVDKEQQLLLRSDGSRDTLFHATAKEEINFLLTYAATHDVDMLQYRIENDSTISQPNKVRFLRGLEYMLRYFTSAWKTPELNAAHLPEILKEYQICMYLHNNGKTIATEISKLPYDVGLAILKSDIFDVNPGYTAARYELVRKYCGLYPEQTFAQLRESPNVPFRDSLILVAGHKFPQLLYDYASAGNQLAYAIRQIDDPLVKTITKMADTRGRGQIYFPFLDNIYKGKLSFEEIDAVRNDSIAYYKLLVKTRLDYVSQIMNKESVYGLEVLNDRLKKKAESVFVNVINGLHEEPDAVRFRILQQLNAEELYYVAVLNDGVIYTSSYTKGVYPLMMSKIANRGDSLLLRVKFDKYRKFIKMAAGYNTLNNFLASFPDDANAKTLMRAFINGLEKSEGLEDGVDVADSYASIAESNQAVASEMLRNVHLNYQKNFERNDKRGMAMYNILNKLFLSADSTKKIDLTKELGIPPVYEVKNKALISANDKVIMQVFFYGDKDGQTFFRAFAAAFASGNWKTDNSNPQWITISSTTGKPVSIYANRPLPEEGGEDEKAQHALDDYLKKNNLDPTVVVHRGHSYYAPYTIAQIQPSAKIIFMGSCGGYHLIHDILKTAPDAHIIASKQIGKGSINQSFFNLLTDKLRNGSDIEWIPFWKELDQRVRVEGLEDYIPPYKNLGALFIKAYKIEMGETGE